MSRMKSVFAIAVLIAVAGAVQAANAQATLKVLIVGASGTWQNLAEGTYKAGACPTGARAGCGHASYGKPTTVDLNDIRPSFSGHPTVTDTGNMWLVWDNMTADPTCATSCSVWAYIKVDSIVGNRCSFATPRCTVTITSFPATPDQVIAAASYWPAEVNPPGPIQSLFTTGSTVNVAASEIRPEDAAFGQCRINSALGGGNDGLAGLGYGTNASGVCPAFGAPISALEGDNLISAYPGSSTTAHPMAFNISGHDPFTNSTVPAFTTKNIGAVPLIFVYNRQDPAGLQPASGNVTLHQLQTVFSGRSCLGSDLGGGANHINEYQREPLSGTMNTAEYTAFRLPRDSAGNYDTVNGASQETGIGTFGISGSTVTVSALPCTTGGNRYRSVGQGDETSFVQNSTTNYGVDGVGYIFFSYGNVKALADSPNYGYFEIDGVDPIWQLYGSTYDPGQPTVSGELPTQADLPTTCAGGAHLFPCAESKIWAGGQSFPHVRDGSYRQWIMVRLIGQTGSASLTAAGALITSAQAAAVTTIPDYVPAVASGTDGGLHLLHSHYTQDGVAPSNALEKGGDVGGCILPAGSTATKLVYRDPSCVAGP